ncbi:MAG: tungstate transport system permease protein [Thermoleophilaceae bacterium]|nr:tungstate transport system permease protein [Thermoleophilaceae bacterium]
MQFIWEGISDALDLLVSGDPELFGVIGFTLAFAFASTALALVAGLPLALALGLGRFRGRRAALAGANAGLGLPPVVIGLFVALLLFRQGPFGGLHLIYTFEGIVLGQALLALPIIAALGAASIQGVPGDLLDQARALGAGRLQVAALALREARIGVIAAAIAALGSALSEVGLVVLVGGNITGETQTLASAVLVEVSAGNFSQAIALGLVLLGLILLVSAGLTIAQQRAPRWTAHPS